MPAIDYQKRGYAVPATTHAAEPPVERCDHKQASQDTTRVAQTLMLITACTVLLPLNWPAALHLSEESCTAAFRRNSPLQHVWPEFQRRRLDHTCRQGLTHTLSPCDRLLLSDSSLHVAGGRSSLQPTLCSGAH